MRTFIIPLLFILFLVPLATAQSTVNYTSYANEDKQGELGSGVFNSNLANAQTTVSTRTLTTGRQAPLVVDMDNDGVSEIIILDDDSVSLFNNKEVDIVDSYSFTSSFVEGSNMIAYDIDDDGRTEVIIAHGDASSERIHIIDYNGTAMVNTSLDWTTANRDTNGDISIACRDTNDCLLIFAESEDVAGQDDMRMLFFNSTSIGSEVLLDQVSFANGFFCHPFMRGITVTDNDGDGIDEYFFTAIEHDNAELDMNWFLWDIEVTLGVPSASVVINAEDTGVAFPQTDDTCSSFNQDITPPLVFDFDSNPSNGFEYLVAIASSSTEFLIKAYESDGSDFDEYPETDDSDGKIISNLVKTDVFSDTNNIDVCVLGFNNADSTIFMTCGSGSTGETPQTHEFDVVAPFNVTEGADHYNTILHSVQHSSASVEGNNVNEFSTAYGIISIGETDVLGNGDLDIEFALAQTDGAVVPIDGEQFGIDDLLVLTDTNIYYVDDGQSNEEASITSITFNPCPVDTVIQVNETMTMNVVITDNNPAQISQDQVSTRVTFYDGDSNEFSVSSPNVTSGSSIPVTGNLNKTITLGSIKVEAFDAFDGAVDDTQTQLFTVQNVGIESGDVTCTSSFVAEETTLTAEELALQNFQDNNSLIQGADALGELMFQSESNQTMRTVIFLIFMVLIALVIVGGESVFGLRKGSDPSITFSVLAFVEFLTLMIGYFTGFISFGVLLTIIVIALAILGLAIRNMFFSTQQS